MTTPALALLKQLRPEYRVDVLAFGALGSSVYANSPDCEQRYLVEDVLDKSGFFHGYDFIVAAHRDSKVMELVPKIDRPITLIDPADQQQAQAMQALDFIRAVFAADDKPDEPIPYRLFPRIEDAEYISAFLPPAHKLIGFHLGCHGINKKVNPFPWRRKTEHKKLWPLHNFVLLAKQLKQSHPDCRIVLTGGANEAHMAEAFMREVPDAINLTGKTDVLQLAALMKRFAAFVCPDTGPMHVACAMDIPLVTFFGPTNMTRTGPYPVSNRRRVLLTEDLSRLSHGEIFRHLEELLG